MQSQTSNSGQTQNLYASPDEGMPNRNKIGEFTSSQLDPSLTSCKLGTPPSFRAFRTFRTATGPPMWTDWTAAVTRCLEHISQLTLPLLVPLVCCFGSQFLLSTHYTSLVLVMYHQPTRSCSAYQGPSGFAWSQQPLERVPPTHSQFPNLQTATSPFWIPGQIVPR